VRNLKQKHEEEYWDQSKSLEYYIDRNFKRIFYFTDDFLTTLTKTQLTDEERYWNYNAVKHVTKEFCQEGFLIFDFYDRLMFVVNSFDSHRYLAEINCESLEKFKFLVYDSLGNPRKGVFARASLIMRISKKFCIEQINDKCCSKYQRQNHNCGYKKRVDKADYEFLNVPRQENGSDCGVFVYGFLEKHN